MFNCNLCEKGYDTDKLLKWHINMQHGLTNRPKCQNCGKQFKSEKHLVKHQVVCSSNDFICNLCERMFDFKSSLEMHILRRNCLMKPKCDDCKREFGNEDLFKNHELYCDAKPCSCSVCHKIFPNKYKLNSHFIMHSNEKPFPCCFCEKFFKRASELDTHLKIHTGERPFKCAECDAAFITASARTTHSVTHNEIRPFACTVCDLSFKLQRTLKNHQLQHEEKEKTHKCEACSLAFLTKGRLLQHMKTHTDIKPYKCPRCEKHFGQLSYLKTHMKRSHATEKMFSCNICFKSFAQKYILNKHMKSHIGKQENVIKMEESESSDQTVVAKLKPTMTFYCEICRKGFGKKYNLIKHRAVHKVGPYTGYFYIL